MMAEDGWSEEALESLAAFDEVSEDDEDLS